MRVVLASKHFDVFNQVHARKHTEVVGRSCVRDVTKKQIVKYLSWSAQNIFFLMAFFNSFLSLLFCTAPLLFRREGQKERRFVTLYFCFQTQLIIFKSLIWKLISYNIILKAFRSNWGAFFTYFKTSAINVFIDNENFNFPFNETRSCQKQYCKWNKSKKKHIWPFFSKEHPSYNHSCKSKKA